MSGAAVAADRVRGGRAARAGVGGERVRGAIGPRRYHRLVSATWIRIRCPRSSRSRRRSRRSARSSCGIAARPLRLPRSLSAATERSAPNVAVRACEESRHCAYERDRRDPSFLGMTRWAVPLSYLRTARAHRSALIWFGLEAQCDRSDQTVLPGAGTKECQRRQRVGPRRLQHLVDADPFIGNMRQARITRPVDDRRVARRGEVPAIRRHAEPGQLRRQSEKRIRGEHRARQGAVRIAHGRREPIRGRDHLDVDPRYAGDGLFGDGPHLGGRRARGPRRGSGGDRRRSRSDPEQHLSSRRRRSCSPRRTTA